MLRENIREICFRPRGQGSTLTQMEDGMEPATGAGKHAGNQNSVCKAYEAGPSLLRPRKGKRARGLEK